MNYVTGRAGARHGTSTTADQPRDKEQPNRVLGGCALECDASAEQKLATINEFNMATRYPSQKSDFYKTATREFAELHLASGKEIFQWIDEILQQSR